MQPNFPQFQPTKRPAPANRKEPQAKYVKTENDDMEVETDADNDSQLDVPPPATEAAPQTFRPLVSRSSHPDVTGIDSVELAWQVLDGLKTWQLTSGFDMPFALIDRLFRVAGDGPALIPMIDKVLTLAATDPHAMACVQACIEVLVAQLPTDLAAKLLERTASFAKNKADRPTTEPSLETHPPSFYSHEAPGYVSAIDSVERAWQVLRYLELEDLENEMNMPFALIDRLFRVAGDGPALIPMISKVLTLAVTDPHAMACLLACLDVLAAQLPTDVAEQLVELVRSFALLAQLNTVEDLGLLFAQPELPQVEDFPARLLGRCLDFLKQNAADGGIVTDYIVETIGLVVNVEQGTRLVEVLTARDLFLPPGAHALVLEALEAEITDACLAALPDDLHDSYLDLLAQLGGEQLANPTNIPHRPGQQIIPIEQDPFVHLMGLDPGYLIIELDKASIDFTAPRADESLKATVELYHHLAYVNKALNERVRKHPHYGAEREAIKWLFRLNRLGANTTYSSRLSSVDISKLIHSDLDVWLPNRPNAQRRRTEVLVQRLIWCTNIELFKTLLSELFQKLRSGVDAFGRGMFIDLKHVALSAISAAVRNFGFESSHATEILRHIAEALHLLPAEHRAACWAELAVLARKNPGTQTAAWDALDKLTATDHQLSSFRQFVHEAYLFLNDPSNAPDELREAMIAHLERDDTSCTPSNVEVLEHLAKLVKPTEGVTPLSEHQSARVRRILVRYMEALNAMHTNFAMSEARRPLSRIPVDLLISAFSELEVYDKLKLVNIIFDINRPRGLHVFLAELNTWLPVIRSTLNDRSISLEQRRRLVASLLARVKWVPHFADAPAAVELASLQAGLERIALDQGN